MMMMMLRGAASRSSASSSLVLLRRSLATQVVEGSTSAPNKEGPIGEDGRHEIWREDIYDHDNEPR